MKQTLFPALKKACTALVYLVAGILTALVLASLLDHFDLIPGGWAIYGIDFLPPVWLLGPVVVVSSLAWFYASRALATGMLILYGVLLVGYGDFSIPWFHGSVPQPDGAHTLSVAALNVRYYSYGLDNVLSAVKGIGADVTLLSENTLTREEEDTLRTLFAPADFAMGRQNGTAIISRYPLLQFREIDLPSHEASLSGGNDVDSMSSHPHRSFIHAVINMGGSRVHVLSIRFIAGRPKDHTLAEGIRWGRYLLEAQQLEVQCFVDYVSHLDGPVVFGGDLNAPPGSKTMRRISRIAEDAQLEHHVWGGFTFRTELPLQRLDYLFSLHGVHSLAAQRLDIVVSDHFPVFARFAVPPSGALSTRITGSTPVH